MCSISSSGSRQGACDILISHISDAIIIIIAVLRYNSKQSIYFLMELGAWRIAFTYFRMARDTR